MLTNNVFEQIHPDHRCGAVAECFVWSHEHWHEWDETLTVQSGDLVQLLEYMESDDELSTICDSHRDSVSARLEDTDSETEWIQLLQLSQSCSRGALAGLQSLHRLGHPSALRS